MAAADCISQRRESDAARSANSVDGGLSIPTLQLHGLCEACRLDESERRWLGSHNGTMPEAPDGHMGSIPYATDISC